MTGLAIGVAVVLLAANAVFVAVEFALIAANRARLEHLAADGSRSARSALRAMSDLNRQLAGAQLGITMMSLGLGFLAEPTIAHLLEQAFGGLPPEIRHPLAFAVALSIVVFLHMVLREMVPKNLALAGAETTLMRLATPHRLFVTLLSPVVWLLNGLANIGVRLLGGKVVHELGTAHTAQELVTLVDASRGEGLIDDFFHRLLSGALDLGDRQVGEVLVPRDDVVWAPRDTTVAELVDLARRYGHSRIPLGGEHGLDTLVGYVHVKDLLLAPTSADRHPAEARLLRRMLVLGSDRTLEDVLRAMKRSQLHVAVVRDAAGRTAGIVTLEDVLEELVGDIVDESDRIRSVVG